MSESVLEKEVKDKEFEKFEKYFLEDEMEVCFFKIEVMECKVVE